MGSRRRARHLLARRIRVPLALAARGRRDHVDRPAVLLQLRPDAGVRRDGGRGPQQRVRQAHVARAVVVPVGGRGDASSPASSSSAVRRTATTLATSMRLLQVPARHQLLTPASCSRSRCSTTCGWSSGRTSRSSSPTPATCRPAARPTPNAAGRAQGAPGVPAEHDLLAADARLHGRRVALRTTIDACRLPSGSSRAIFWIIWRRRSGRCSRRTRSASIGGSEPGGPERDLRHAQERDVHRLRATPRVALFLYTVLVEDLTAERLSDARAASAIRARCCGAVPNSGAPDCMRRTYRCMSCSHV